LPQNNLKWVLLLTVLSVWFLLAGLGFALVVTAIAVTLLLRWLMLQRIGGLTGDMAGANVELVEVVLLVVAVTLAHS